MNSARLIVSAASMQVQALEEYLRVRLPRAPAQARTTGNCKCAAYTRSRRCKSASTVGADVIVGSQVYSDRQVSDIEQCSCGNGRMRAAKAAHARSIAERLFSSK